MQNSQKYRAKRTQKLEDLAFNIELKIDANLSFDDILLEAIDEALLSLGESVKTSIFFYLQNIWGIKKQEIPFRIEDFQNALEKLFGIGARHLEILFMKKLHEKFKVSYKWDMPRWVVPDLTFQEYLSIAKMNFENSNTK